MDSVKPFFSVIIPVYNKVTYIEKTLESLITQEYKNFELIIIDDGSTDDSIEFIEKWIVEKSIGRLIRQNNAGPGAARNKGAELARGTYMCFLDADDYWFKGTLSNFATCILQYDYPAFVAGGSINFVADIELGNSVPSEDIDTVCYKNYAATAHEELWIGTPSVAIKRESYIHVGGFTNQRVNAEDSDLWLKLSNEKGFVWIINPPIFAYRRLSNSTVSDGIKTYSGMLLLLENAKNGAYGDLTKIAPILTRHIRPVSLALLEQREFMLGLNLFVKSFQYNLRGLRIKYFFGFWLKFIQHVTIKLLLYLSSQRFK